MVPRIQSEEEARSFYDHWKSVVFTYCFLYLGDEPLAEEATQEAFVRFFQQGSTRFWRDGNRVPLSLLQGTLVAAQKRCAIRQPSREKLGNAIEDVIPLLPCEQRMIFILRSVLNLSYEMIAVATGFEQQQAAQYWLEASLRMRQLFLKKSA